MAGTATPVVAYRRGSMPELVMPGRNGTLVDSLEDAVAAVGLATDLDRAGVRRTVEERFGADRVVAEYLAVHRGVLGR